MIEIYTDGSAVARKGAENNMKGGFGVVFTIDGEIKKTISKGMYPTKTGRMELMAILSALKILAKDQKAVIFSDSMYCISCFNKGWLKNWERNNWPERIKNKDILQLLLYEYRKFRPRSIIFKHVKGHSGNKFNEIADKLASYKNFDVFERDLDIEL